MHFLHDALQVGIDRRWVPQSGEVIDLFGVVIHCRATSRADHFGGSHAFPLVQRFIGLYYCVTFSRPQRSTVAIQISSLRKHSRPKSASSATFA